MDSRKGTEELFQLTNMLIYISNTMVAGTPITWCLSVRYQTIEGRFIRLSKIIIGLEKSGSDILDKEEWKEDFKKRREKLKREMEDILTILRESPEELSIIGEERHNLISAMDKLIHLYKDLGKFSPKERLKEHSDLSDEVKKLETEKKMSDKYLQDLEKYAERGLQIESEIKKKSEKCPECDGNGEKVTSEWVEADIEREQIPHTEKCALCNGRGKVPVDELLDP